MSGPTNTALYVPMPDGVRLAVDVWLPEAAGEESPLPALLTATRYWRAAVAEEEPPADLRPYLEAGYAYVLVDVRGTGASFGSWPHAWSPTEIDDMGHIVDWIVSQPWSNGRVGATGVSYPANVAELLPLTGRAAVRAVAPRFSDFDAYRLVTNPGGVAATWFTGAWTAFAAGLDGRGEFPPEILELMPFLAAGVKRVDEDHDGSLLAAAVAEHAGNDTAGAAVSPDLCRDDAMEGSSLSLSDVCPQSFADDLTAAGVPMYSTASWLDAGTARGALERVSAVKVPQVVRIGATNHGANLPASPWQPPEAPVDPPKDDQVAELIAFFDAHLKDGGTKPEPRIHYYTLGAESWSVTESWPPSGTSWQRLYLDDGRSLASEEPVAAGEDDYAVDFEASTGDSNRWHTQMGLPVHYGDRAEADGRLLCYTSAPLEQATEITGEPVVKLRLRSTHPDGAVFVYLEVVAADGYVRYVTEGQLRLAHRRGTLLRDDLDPLVPGEVADIRVALLPTSVLVRAGERLRLAIAGADDGTFTRLPPSGDPVLTIERGGGDPSWLDLPVRSG